MSDGKSITNKAVYEFADFRLDAAERVLERAGRPVSAAPKALDVLIVLVENCGHIVEKEELIKQVWPGVFIEENNLAFNISVLRKIFGESSGTPSYIETVPRRGYRFIAEVRNVPKGGVVPRPSRRFGRSRMIVKFGRSRIVAGAVALFAAVGILATRFQGGPKLTNRDTLVLADFVNKTGDPVFDETLRQGLVLALEQSPFLSILPEARVQRTLRLMQQPAGTPLTAGLAQDVCQRTGSTVVVEGSIITLGNEYVLGVRATNCSGAEMVRNEQIQVKRKEDVLSALTQIARKFRSRAGESPATLQSHDVPLEEATTTSIEALRAYSAAWKLQAVQGATASLPLFLRAAELDPEFAMAHASLGRTYADLDEFALSTVSLQRAWELRNRTTSRENFFIRANYHLLVTGNLEEARKVSEAWVRTYPRDMAAHMMLSSQVNKVPGRFEEAAAEAEKAIGIDPEFGMAYYNVAVNKAYSGRFEEAQNALQRAAARGLRIEEHLMLAHDLAFLKNDVEAMERIAAQARARSAPESWITIKEAFVHAYFGRQQMARDFSGRAVAEALEGQQIERAGLWEAGAAIREALLGNKLESRQRAASALKRTTDAEVEYGAAFALAHAGDVVRSQEIADDLDKRFPEDMSVRFSYLPTLRARLLLDKSEPQHALEVLENAIPIELGAPRSVAHGFFGALYPIYVRGETYLALRKGEQAATEFRKIIDHPGIVVSDPIGVLAHLQLGRALALAGEKTKAKSAYRDFLLLWKDADAGIPVLRQAKAEYAGL